LIHLQTGRCDEAIDEFRKIVEAQPEFEQGHYKLGFMLARMGRYPDAITEFKKVVALDFKNAEAHYNLGLAYSRNGESNEAHQELAAACRLNPDLCRKQPR